MLDVILRDVFKNIDISGIFEALPWWGKAIVGCLLLLVLVLAGVGIYYGVTGSTSNDQPISDNPLL